MKTKLAVLAVVAVTAMLTLGVPLRAQSPASQGKAAAYYLAEFEVTDRQGLRPYAEQVESTFAPFSGRYIVRGGQIDRLEGNPPTNRMVIIAFDSLDLARAWYNSPEYAKIRPIRQRSGHTNAYIIEGLPN
jgi:uncharacterized protein (DUF1330 family)